MPLVARENDDEELRRGIAFCVLNHARQFGRAIDERDDNPIHVVTASLERKIECIETSNVGTLWLPGAASAGQRCRHAVPSWRDAAKGKVTRDTDCCGRHTEYGAAACEHGRERNARLREIGGPFG